VGEVSGAAVDRLGERLRAGRPSEEDLRLLDRWRRSFGGAYQLVFELARRVSLVEPTGRDAKSTETILQKLRRESVRLSQMQDIAGVRVVVPGLLEQDATVGRLLVERPDAKVLDRRATPSHGYRAVHVLVPADERVVELQVRTVHQHEWAEWSEKVAKLISGELKYGGGPVAVRQQLLEFSRRAADLDEIDREIATAVAAREADTAPANLRLSIPGLQLTRDIAWSELVDERQRALEQWQAWQRSEE
jgi:ppGpp synthetase/RelA/SpoT-type nucleotidyltranferase